jgi:hypothetical protein
MALTSKRIEQIVSTREALSRAVADLEWAYRGLYYGNDSAPPFDRARQHAEKATRTLLDLLPQIANDVNDA